MAIVRLVISYGMALELPHCARLHAIIAGGKAGGFLVAGNSRTDLPSRRGLWDAVPVYAVGNRRRKGHET
jgi:hypothetical protein